MSATPSEIRNWAAEKLGVVGEGESLRSSISADLDQAYLEVHDELENDGLVFWSNTSEAIPDAYTPHLISLVAASRAVRHKVPMERYQQLTLEAQQAMRSIWKLSETHKMSKTEIEYF